MDFAAHCPPVEGFLTKREKIIKECLLFELHQTASYQREGPRLRLVDWLGTRIPGGCLSRRMSLPEPENQPRGSGGPPFFFEHSSFPQANTSLVMDTSISRSIGHNFNYVGSFYFTCKFQKDSEICGKAYV